MAEEKREVPEEEAAFTTMLKKYQVGAKGGMAAETIAENISRTGGEFVFEDPQKLAERLSTWHEYISPVKRKQIIEQWFAEKGLPVSKEIIEIASIKGSDMRAREEEEKKKREDEEKQKSKFAVDPDGAIRQARQGETPLTMSEAETISDRIKRGHEGKDAAGAKPGKFTMDAEGNLKVVEGATLSAEDVAIMQAVAKAQEAGDKRSAFEILEEEIKRFDLIEGFRGGGRKEGGLAEEAEKWKAIKEVFGMDEEMKTILGAVATNLERLGKGGTESPEVRALQGEVTKLREQLETKDRERLEGTITALRNELTNTRDEFQKALADAGGKNEYGIMSQAVTVIDKRLGAIESLIQGVFGQRPPPMPAGERKRLTEGIMAESEEAEAVRALGEKIFFRQGPQT